MVTIFIGNLNSNTNASRIHREFEAFGKLTKVFVPMEQGEEKEKEQGEEQGKERGKEQGKEKGTKQGKEQGKKQNKGCIRNLLGQGLRRGSDIQDEQDKARRAGGEGQRVEAERLI
jgi:hypothetical protein